MTHQHRPRTDTRRWICRERSRADLDQVHINKRADRLFLVRAVPLVLVHVEPKRNTVHVFAFDSNCCVSSPAVVRKFQFKPEALVVFFEFEGSALCAAKREISVMIPK